MAAGEQAGFQMLCLIVSFSIAVITGAISGFIVKFIDPLKETDGYLDSAHWEVPEQEIPFFMTVAVRSTVTCSRLGLQVSAKRRSISSQRREFSPSYSLEHAALTKVPHLKRRASQARFLYF